MNAHCNIERVAHCEIEIMRCVITRCLSNSPSSNNPKTFSPIPCNDIIACFNFVSEIDFSKLFQGVAIGKRDARYRIRDNYLLVDVKVPQDGQYGLDIFARETWEEKMVHCCKYLINCDV